nr:GGDEF domain-containing protein [uncultured Gellertiella sp.]
MLSSRRSEQGTADISAAQVEREIAGGVAWLRFAPPLEAVYESDHIQRQMRQMNKYALVALVLYNLFLIADYLMVRDVLREAVVVRLAIVTPVALLLYGLMRRSQLVRFRDLFTILHVLLVVGSTAYLLVISKDPDRVLYNQGVLLVIIYACLIQRMRFWYSVLCCLFVNITFAGAIVLQDLRPVEQGLALEMTVALGTIFTLVAAYTMEREHRLFYLISLKERLHAAAMEGISIRDALTGLYNRRALDAKLLDISEGTGGWQNNFAVIIFDIDHFKVYNDRLGHQAGDDCLKQVAGLILSLLRDGHDYAFRYGGEEFLLLVREADLNRAVAIAERIRCALEGRAIPHPESPTGPCVTASFGVAHASSLHATPAEVIARADMALYAAKNKGRNRVWPSLAARLTEARDRAGLDIILT